MITRNEISKVLEKYNLDDIHIGVLGSHSALDVMDGAKDEDFKTIVVCQRGREKPYLMYKRLCDEIIVLDKFSQIVNEEVQRTLRELNTVFVPHRAFTTYVPYDDIEERFLVPIFGNRAMLRTEERWAPRNQYYLLEKAGIRQPKKFKSPDEIDRLVIVKVPEAKRKIERAFFTASDPEDYWRKARERIEKGIITEEDLKSAVIEEFVIGTYFNFNYFYSPLDDELEFLGIDRRLQTNIYDFVNLPARQQLDVDVPLQNIEVGHMPATIRESLLEKVFDIGLRFVEVTKKEYPPGIIGPFALQGAVTVDLDIVIFDVSPRVPGSPVLITTSPYSKFKHGFVVGTGRRIAMELKKAVNLKRLIDVVT
ncbi:MAG: formate--phosphoribosylaminoimidazolecarboxamide ligase family protein [Candidatus Nezhaarchaeales archaeon]|nr:MAG: 5-formaminoimidazole-4-carboxamide-1-(beta)-D-ribofuranosyl 5'-monophosphate synthetase [Candidatus Nezhaarchaeota archaeon WYZ-LMO8]TDA37349.1 MAG: 5-formaminoimidazole-4-carboxamide-1-(beta)-D-ribofuranosyl 5'-monophosphate synthetase [Candidatus Nezhaarchaeota archaeon WYZ-LMO7]